MVCPSCENRSASFSKRFVKGGGGRFRLVPRRERGGGVEHSSRPFPPPPREERKRGRKTPSLFYSPGRGEEEKEKPTRPARVC